MNIVPIGRVGLPRRAVMGWKMWAHGATRVFDAAYATRETIYLLSKMSKTKESARSPRVFVRISLTAFRVSCLRGSQDSNPCCPNMQSSPFGRRFSRKASPIENYTMEKSGRLTIMKYRTKRKRILAPPHGKRPRGLCIINIIT